MEIKYRFDLRSTMIIAHLSFLVLGLHNAGTTEKGSIFFPQYFL